MDALYSFHQSCLQVKMAADFSVSHSLVVFLVCIREQVGLQALVPMVTKIGHTHVFSKRLTGTDKRNVLCSREK